MRTVRVIHQLEKEDDASRASQQLLAWASAQFLLPFALELGNELAKESRAASETFPKPLDKCTQEVAFTTGRSE